MTNRLRNKGQNSDDWYKRSSGLSLARQLGSPKPKWALNNTSRSEAISRSFLKSLIGRHILHGSWNREGNKAILSDTKGNVLLIDIRANKWRWVCQIQPVPCQLLFGLARENEFLAALPDTQVKLICHLKMSKFVLGQMLRSKLRSSIDYGWARKNSTTDDYKFNGNPGYHCF